MNKFERVRGKICGMDGGEFQALGQRYAMLKFNLSSPVALGMFPGTMKTVKGTPDAYFKDENDDYVFVECGHVMSGAAQAVKKIRDDIEKCLALIDRSSQPLSVSKIICCYAFPYIDPSREAELKSLDENRVVLVGPDQIARDICDQYFSLAEEYLGLAYPNGNILDYDKFIRLHAEDAYATPLDNALIGRESESGAFFNALESGQTVVLCGRSGCGKTRLALDVSKRFCEQSGTLFSIIRSGIKRSLYEELREYYSDGRNHVILVDDVNQLFDIDELVEFCLLNRNIHLVCTVRSYALEQASKSLKRLGNVLEIALEPLDKSAIELILKDTFSVRNQIYLDQIIKVSKGNLRLAILAAKKAKNGYTEITNCKDLLDLCYGDAVNQWDGNLVLACEIASILGAHTTCSDNLATLERALSITQSDYINACVELCGKEVMDMVHDYQAVNMAEQNLRDYFIYRCLIDERILTVEDLWSLERGQSIVAKALNVLFEVFNDEALFEFAKKGAKALWPKLSVRDKYLAIETFNALIETDALMFLRQQIRDLEPRVGDYSAVSPSWTSGKNMVSSDVLKSLCVLLQGDNVGQTVDLIFRHLEIDSSPIDDFCAIFFRRLRPTLEYDRVNYRIVMTILERFESKVQSGFSEAEKAMLTLFSLSVMDDELSGVRNGEGNEVTFYRGTLPLSEELLNIRCRCLDCLGAIDEATQQDVLLRYRPSFGPSDDEKLAAATYKIVDERLDLRQATTLRRIIQVIELDRFMEHSEYGSTHMKRFIESSWQNRFLAVALHRDFLDGEFSDSQIVNLAAEASRESIFQLLDLFESDLGSGRQGNYAIELAVRVLFEYLKDNSPVLFDDAICRYLQNGLWPCQIGLIAAAYFFDGDDPKHGREKLLSMVGGNCDMWASEYDGYCISQKKCIPDEKAILDSAKKGSIPLSCFLVWGADAISPGFFAECVKIAMAFSHDKGSNLALLLPCTEDGFGMRALERTIEKLEGLRLIESALLLSVENCIQICPKATISLVLERDPQYIKEIVPVLLRSGGDEYWEDWVVDIIWGGLFCLEDIKTLAILICRQEGNAYWYEGRKFLGDLIKGGESHGKMNESFELLAELECAYPNDSVVGSLRSELSQNAKIELAVKLAKEGSSWEQIKPLACDSKVCESWSGSYLSVLKRRRGFASKVQERFKAEGIRDYDLDFLDLYQSFDEAEKETEIKDFVDPYL